MHVDPAAQHPASHARRRHWRRNLSLTAGLLLVWAAVGLGCGVLFADWFNRFEFLGFPLGFWFAQQGSILTFVVLILIYALGMRRIDRALAHDLAAIDASEQAS